MRQSWCLALVGALLACAGPRRATVAPPRAVVSSAPLLVAAGPTEEASDAPWPVRYTPGRAVIDADVAVRGGVAAAVALLGDGGAGHEVLVTLLDGALRPIGRRTLGRDDRVCSVAIAASGEGWVVALGLVRGAEARVETQWLSEDLSQGGDPASINLGERPRLTARPEGGPLMQWIDRSAPAGGALRVALLPPRAAPLWTTVAFENPTESEYGSAAWTGEGFLLAQRVGGVAVRTVSLDGRLGPLLAVDDDQTEYPQVSASAAGVTISWAHFGGTPSMRMALLDRDGRRTGAPITLGAVPAWFDPAPTLDDGDSSLVLLAGYTGATGVASRLSWVTVPRGGTPSAPRAVYEGPGPVRDYHVARFADAPLVWWVSAQGRTLWVVRPSVRAAAA